MSSGENGCDGPACKRRAQRRKLHQNAVYRTESTQPRPLVHSNAQSQGQVPIKLLDTDLNSRPSGKKSHLDLRLVRRFWLNCLVSAAVSFLILSLANDDCQHSRLKGHLRPNGVILASGSLIIGDSAIEIQEVDDQQSQQQQPQNNAAQMQGQQQQASQEQASPVGSDQQLPNIFLGANDPDNTLNPSIQGQANADMPLMQMNGQGAGNHQKLIASSGNNLNRLPSGPLPPLGKPQASEDITDGDKNSRPDHDYVLDESPGPKDSLAEVISAPSKDDSPDTDSGKMIMGKVVDFELEPAGGHNKAKIKKKKKKKKMESEEKAFKKWNKKKKAEKKAMEKEEKKHMKKKKEEGKKKKKKWGMRVHGQKKKGSFKKKKWGKKVKKGKGVKRGKKGKKFLKDKGHKNTGFKTVYHKEEWGKSAKWHDIKREKKWDEKSKKWKKKWKKEKGKKYKGDHMKKFEKKKKEGKKYKKAKEEKFKKYKKEKFEKGKKKKMEEHKKKKEGGMKKEEKEMKKKKKKKP